MKKPIKTVYLQDLEGLKHLLHADRLTTTGGKKCSLHGILYELDGLHQKFQRVLAVIRKDEYHCEALDFDRDVNYLEWSGNMHLNFNYPICPLLHDAEVCLDIVGVDRSMTDGLNALSEEQLVYLIDQRLMAFKALLAEIGEALKDFRPDGEALFLEEEARYEREHGAEVRRMHNEWKEQFGYDPELIKKHLQGKVTNEIVRLAESGALMAKYRTQFEADTEQYLPEMGSILTSLIPKGMNFKYNYSALRELMDYSNGELLPNEKQLGLYIFHKRKEMVEEERKSLFFFLAILKLIYLEKEREGKTGKTRATGRTPESLFMDSKGLKDEAKTREKASYFLTFLKREGMQDCTVDNRKGNFVNKAFIVCYQQWSEEKTVPVQPNGNACFRFLKEDCGMLMETSQKTYANFIREYIAGSCL